MSYQVVLLVVHLGRVSPHAVDGQQQIHEGKRRVEPQQVRPGTTETQCLILQLEQFLRSCAGLNLILISQPVEPLSFTARLHRAAASRDTCGSSLTN